MAQSPADIVLERIGKGSPTRVAEICGVGRTQIWKWRAPKAAGGLGGTVPRRHWPALISYAREHNIELPVELLAPELAA